MQRETNVDVLILGAGPAGLAAGSACQEAGLNFRIVEEGRQIEKRDHRLEAELGRGVGGAGLYSDGKFSFFPSATALWKLEPRGDLEISYAWLSSLLAKQSINVPETPLSSDLCTLSELNSFFLKVYPSIYASIDKRMSLIDSLQSILLDRLLTMTRVLNLSVGVDSCHAAIANYEELAPITIIAKKTILATGRFGPLFIQQASNLETVYRRLEVGIRIQQPNNRFFLNNRPELDPKLVLDKHGEHFGWRTFCCCRDGQIVTIEQANVTVLSGRSDVRPTGFSNVGFHVRVRDPNQAQEVWADLISRLTAAPPAKMPLAAFLCAASPALTPIGRLLGPTLSFALMYGLQQLLVEFGPASFDEATIHGPTLEGLGQYPKLGLDLKAQGLPVWGAGDVTGMFRGLVAALVSGYFVGLQARKFL